MWQLSCTQSWNTIWEPIILVNLTKHEGPSFQSVLGKKYTFTLYFCAKKLIIYKIIILSTKIIFMHTGVKLNFWSINYFNLTFSPCVSKVCKHIWMRSTYKDPEKREMNQSYQKSYLVSITKQMLRSFRRSALWKATIIVDNRRASKQFMKKMSDTLTEWY